MIREAVLSGTLISLGVAGGVIVGLLLVRWWRHHKKMEAMRELTDLLNEDGFAYKSDQEARAITHLIQRQRYEAALQLLRSDTR